MDSNHTHQAPIGYGVYIFIWLGLLVLTGLTVAVSGVNLRFLAVATALAIAAVKSYLVVSYFMHIKYDATIFKRMLIFMTTILAVILILTFFDVAYRPM